MHSAKSHILHSGMESGDYVKLFIHTSATVCLVPNFSTIITFNNNNNISIRTSQITTGGGDTHMI